MKFDYVFFNEKLLSKNPIFVEIGSHSGRLGNFLKDKGKVIIYEPSKINFKILKNNIDNFKIWNSDIKLWNKAVGSFNGRISFYDYKKGLSAASTFKKDFSILDEYMIEVINIKTLMIENNINKIDLLVLTCEGCELGILENISDFNIRQICVSFSEKIYGKKIKSELIKKMSEKYIATEGILKYKFYLFIKK